MLPKYSWGRGETIPWAWLTPVVTLLVKTNSSSPISNQLSITSQLGVGLTVNTWFLHAEISVWIGFAQVLCVLLQPPRVHVWKQPVVFRKHCFLIVIHCLWFLYSYWFLCCDDPWTLHRRLLFSEHWPVMGLIVSFCLPPRSVSDESWEMHDSIGIVIKY